MRFNRFQGLNMSHLTRIFRRVALVAGISASMILISVSGLRAATFTVANLNDSGAGSLRQAITDANAGAGNDVIQFQSNMTGSINLTTGALPDIVSNIEIIGPSVQPGVTINGRGVSSIFYVGPGGYFEISRLALTNGLGNNGGAIRVEGGNTIISECTIYGNTATNRGGGIYMAGGYLTILNSTISSNRSAQDAGGILCTGGTTKLSFVTITGNTADYNGTFLGEGGGLLRENTAVVLIRNTLIANNYDGESKPDCSSFGGSGYITTFGGNLIGINAGCSTVFPYGNTNVNNDIAGSSVSPVDPRLGAIGDNGGPTSTHSLLTNSPAIDAIPSDGCKDVDGNEIYNDQRIFRRPYGPRCDCGSYEGGSIDGGGGGGGTGPETSVGIAVGCFIDSIL